MEIQNTTRVQKVVLYSQLPIKPEQGEVPILQNNPSVPPQPHEADKATNPAKTDLLEARAPVGRPSHLIIYDPLFSHQHWSQNFYTRSAYLQKLKALPRPMDARNRSWWRRGWMWIVCKAANGHSDKKTSGRSSACGVPLSGYAKAAISLSIKVTFFHLRTGDLVRK